MIIQQSYLVFGEPRRGLSQLLIWFCFRCLPVVLAWMMVALLLSASVARAEPEPEAGQVSSAGHLLLGTVDGDYVPALSHSNTVHFDISGMVAVVSLEQRFSNHSQQWVEGVYGFPLPAQAAVRAMEIVVGERRIIGQVREKSEAKTMYKAAKKAGKKASLVEQQRPNLFTNRIANIGPGEEVVVRLEYVQPVAYVASRFSLRFPMTITARYMPGLPLAELEPVETQSLAINPYLGWAAPTAQVPDAGQISPLQHAQPGSDQQPLNSISITANLDMGMPLASVDSLYHDIALAREGERYRISLAKAEVEMDRDFVLNWQPVSASAPTAAMFTEKVDGEYFGLLMVLPPGIAAGPAVLPREVIFVVDTSGSMGGVSIEQARHSVAAALRQLRPSDRFNIIEFNSSYTALYRSPVPASAQHVQRALGFVQRLQANGGTEMLPALRAALAPSAQFDEFGDQAPLQQVVFVTDGAVGNELQLYEEIAGSLGNKRLFTVGIGSAPNSWFMRKAADFGRGLHTHIGDINEVAVKMDALFEHMSRPVAVDVAVDWPMPVEAWPERVPDLYDGYPLLLAVSFGDQPPTGELSIEANIGGRPWRQQLQLSAGASAAEPIQSAGVASLWARQKIAGLLDLKALGESEEAVKAMVLPVALQHQLLSPYTSFVAVEELISRPAEQGLASKAVPNTRPRGQSAQPYAYPKTATSGPAKLWLGALLLFIAMVIHVMRQPEVDYVRGL